MPAPRNPNFINNDLCISAAMGIINFAMQEWGNDIASAGTILNLAADQFMLLHATPETERDMLKARRVAINHRLAEIGE